VTHKDQVILVAVGFDGRGVIMGYRGAGCPVACTPLDGVQIDYTCEVFPIKDFPDEPGLYVWRGIIDIDGEPIDGPYVEMRGKFEPARDLDEIVDLMGTAEPPYEGLIGDDE
jgi:hypothetical protein